MRTMTVQLETQETITRDGVAVKVNAVLWFRAADPIARGHERRALAGAPSFRRPRRRLRDAIGQSDLDADARRTASASTAGYSTCSPPPPSAGVWRSTPSS